MNKNNDLLKNSFRVGFKAALGVIAAQTLASIIFFGCLGLIGYLIFN